MITNLRMELFEALVGVQYSHSKYSVHLERVHEELQHGHGEEDVGAGGGGAGPQHDGQEHRLQ